MDKKITPWLSLALVIVVTAAFSIVKGMPLMLPISVVLFCAAPLAIRAIRKSPITKGRAILLAAVNNVIGFVVFIVLLMFAGFDETLVWYIALPFVLVAAIWFFPVYAIMRWGEKKTVNKSPATT